jgi:hypothetical protein
MVNEWVRRYGHGETALFQGGPGNASRKTRPGNAMPPRLCITFLLHLNAKLQRLTTSNVVFIRSTELPPTMTSNNPGSTTRRISSL